MGTATQVSLEEYLGTTYRPDCDYIDGEVVERNLGDKKHARTQGRLYRTLSDFEGSLGIWVAPELRFQVKPTRFRVPDLTVTRREPAGDWLTEPPFLLIEILSEGDTLRSIQDRIDDYRQAGAQHIWIVDPEALRGWDASSGAPIEVKDGVLKTAEPVIEIRLASLAE